ncbi:MAG TPA: enoyl-CoA hydratase [Caulobacteraceae bacterium]|jgi:enoyl-CoA hydratase/carnithine racemase|nr:enoyl-CoA hydratase [Caulobacteraceae bacterium]
MKTEFETLILEREDGYAIVRLNRPEALNAFNNKLMDELTECVEALDKDDGVRCIVVTGSEKAFAAGADIKEMIDHDYASAYREDFITRNWEAISRARTPTIAAVAGYALGGGCELAMMCDFIIAAENAKFGQPEITLGVSPGAGGTQRLPRAVGKAKAMDMILTARMMDAAEAERSGLVSRVVPTDKLMEEAKGAAAKIAALPAMAVRATKEMVNAAFETELTHGIRFERRLFHSLFGTEGQKEGMAAFVAKRKPNFHKG